MTAPYRVGGTTRAAPGAALALALLPLLAGCGSAPGPAPAPEYEWRLPPGMPVPRVPPGNPMSTAKVELGRRLFYDTRLSGNGRYSCAHCHRPELAFTDGRARAVGATGELHRRSAMSLVNVAYSPGFTWADPGTTTLEAQMLVPMFSRHPVELGLSGNEARVLQRLAADGELRRRFREAFPGRRPALTFESVVQAISSFERTLVSAGSAYDRYLFWDETDALPAAARRGMRLFFSERLACGECHGGFNLSGPALFEGGPDRPAEFHNTGLYNLDGAGAYPESDRGLMEITGRAEDMGRFRAPSLRNVALTAPYMHDGSVATLEEVLDHYAAAGRARPPSPLRSAAIGGFELSDRERRDLLSFLDSLTDPGLADDPRFAPPGAQKVNEPPIE